MNSRGFVGGSPGYVSAGGRELRLVGSPPSSFNWRAGGLGIPSPSAGDGLPGPGKKMTFGCGPVLRGPRIMTYFHIASLAG